MEKLSDTDWLRLSLLDPPWFPVAPELEATFQNELQGELSEGHSLFGVVVHILARRDNRDDFLFFAPKRSEPWGRVHLTWSYARSKHSEKPPWPSTYFYESFEAFLEEHKDI